MAYLDPGSGSILLQAILGGVAGIALAVKIFGRRFARAIGIKPKQSSEEKSDSVATK